MQTKFDSCQTYNSNIWRRFRRWSLRKKFSEIRTPSFFLSDLRGKIKWKHFSAPCSFSKFFNSLLLNFPGTNVKNCYIYDYLQNRKSKSSFTGRRKKKPPRAFRALIGNKYVGIRPIIIAGAFRCSQVVQLWLFLLYELNELYDRSLCRRGPELEPV